MGVQNQETVLIRSVWAKRKFYTMFLWPIPVMILLSFAFAWWSSVLVQNSGIEVPAEMMGQAFWSSLFFSIVCIDVPILAIAIAIDYRRHRRNSIVVTEERLKCRYGFKKSLDIPLLKVKNLTLNGRVLQSISFYYAGKRRTIRFIENREEIFRVIAEQKKKLEAEQ